MFGFVTVGGLLYGGENRATFGVTQEDIANGYGLSYGLARGSEGLLFAVATGNASSALAGLGTGGEIAAYAIQGLELANNINTAKEGVADAAHNGLGVGNSIQIAAGLLGVKQNISTITRGIPGAVRAAEDAATAEAKAAAKAKFTTPREVKPLHSIIEGELDSPRSPEHTKLQQLLAESTAETGNYKRVSRGSIKLSKFSGLEHSPDIKPDVMGLTHTGQIDMLEIRSSGQRIRTLTQKLAKARDTIPILL